MMSGHPGIVKWAVLTGVRRGMKLVLGIDFPVFEKRRFQHGAVDGAGFSEVFDVPEDRYRQHFAALHR